MKNSYLQKLFHPNLQLGGDPTVKKHKAGHSAAVSREQTSYPNVGLVTWKQPKKVKKPQNFGSFWLKEKSGTLPKTKISL